MASSAAVSAMAARALKLNHYDPDTGILKLTAPEAHAYRQQLKHWTDYFLHPETNGGLKAGLVPDPAELSDFTAFVPWTAWVSVATRPGPNHSYTNNFPFNFPVGIKPTSDPLLWSENGKGPRGERVCQ